MQSILPEFISTSLACPFCGSSLMQLGNNLKCSVCHDVYTSLHETPDLRLRRKKTVSLQFDIGIDVFPSTDFDFNPLTMNPSPEVDYSRIEAQARLSKEQLSYIPKAKHPGSIVLDLGCGHGIHKEVCELAGYKYVGLDYDEADAPMLGDGHALPFKDNNFDFILSIAVLEHIVNPFVMMKEAFRVLKPGGKILGTVAFLEPFHANSCYHHTHLGTYYTLKASGFEIEKVAPSSDWSVLMAQSGLLFSKLPAMLSKIIIMPVYLLHRLWWKTASLFSKKASERNRILFMSGAFTFLATKPV